METFPVAKSGEPRFSSPAELTAILVAAHRAGDAALERSARRELQERFNLRISFGRESRREVAPCK